MNEDRNHEEQNRVVIRDKRRFDPRTGEPRHPDAEPRHAADADSGYESYDDGPTPEATDEEIEAGVLFEPRRKQGRATSQGGAQGQQGAQGSGPQSGQAAQAAQGAQGTQGAAGGQGQDQGQTPSPGAAALQRKLAERTSDLQRITAEYANYRKRVERDRAAAAELGTGAVLAALLPVMDNLDRAREHGDLTGPFKAVADQLTDTLSRLGLEPFGAAGDPFDPMVHEAVAHQTSAEVSEPTCVTVMRVGYRHGERLLRPALVGVAEPEAPGAAPAGSGGPGGPGGSAGPDGTATAGAKANAGNAANAPGRAAGHGAEGSTSGDDDARS